MSDRIDELTQDPLRPVEAALPENLDIVQRFNEKAQARLTLSGETEVINQLEKAVAAGEPGLIKQQIPNYVTEEALVRSFATSFGIVVPEGAADMRPEFTTLAPDTFKVLTVAVTGGLGKARRRVQYRVVEAQTTGSWKEIQTEPVEIPFVNAFFPRKRAILEAQAADKMAYYLRKQIDTISWNIVTNTNVLKTTFLSSDLVWTFKDTDVKGLPAGNKATSTVGFWPTLRQKVIPYFIGANKADRIINVHVLHTDLQYIYQVAAIGTQSLGHYTAHQEKVYAGNIRDIDIYGYRFRIIPENWNLNSGDMYCSVGPLFKLWLPETGSQTYVQARDNGSEVRILGKIYEILSPSPWWTNLYYTTWSTTDTTA